MIDGMKLVVLGGTVETARRVASSGWCALLALSPAEPQLIIASPCLRTCSTTPSSLLQVTLHKL